MIFLVVFRNSYNLQPIKISMLWWCHTKQSHSLVDPSSFIDATPDLNNGQFDCKEWLFVSSLYTCCYNLSWTTINRICFFLWFGFLSSTHKVCKWSYMVFVIVFVCLMWCSCPFQPTTLYPHRFIAEECRVLYFPESK